MVLEHVPQHARLIVKSAAVADAQGFGGGDADVVDVAAVPDRLEQGVGKAQQQDVLHGFLGHVMVDAENPPLCEKAVQNPVQLAGRGQVAAEGLFHDDARGTSAAFPGESGLAQQGDQRNIGRRGHGQIEQAVSGAVRIHFIEQGGESAAGFGALRVDAGVAHAGYELVQGGGLERAGELFSHEALILFRTHVRAARGHDAGVRAEQAALEQYRQGRVDFAHGQIAGAAEDDQIDGIGCGRDGTGWAHGRS